MALNKRVYDDIPHVRRTRDKPEPQPHPSKAQAPHEVWFIDGRMMDCKLNGGKWWSLVILEGYSRTLLAAAVAPAEASWVALLVLYTACRRYGVPQRMLSDSGGAYISNAFEAVCARLEIEHITIVSPQGESWLNIMETHFNLHSAHCRKGLCGRDRQNLPPGYTRLIDGYLRQLCYRAIGYTLKAIMRTGHTGCNTASHHSTGGGPAAARSFHNAILTPGTRLSSVCSGQHRLRKKLRRLWEPNQLQDVRLHRIQAGEAGLDHPSLGIFDLYQTIPTTSPDPLASDVLLDGMLSLPSPLHLIMP